jgi:hypothetical protein
MRKNLFFLNKTWRLWLCLIGMLAVAPFAAAAVETDCTVDYTNIREGYIIVEFPFYDGDSLVSKSHLQVDKNTWLASATIFENGKNAG